MLRRNRIFWFLRIAAFAFLQIALGLPGSAERLPIKVYTTSDGLPRDHINRIVEDSQGFLWFCTSEGLARFDGYRFTNYGVNEGLPSRSVYDLVETHSGTYWIATDNGLCRLVLDPRETGSDPSRKFVVYRPELETGRAVNALCESHDGTVWCGTEAGLFRLVQTNGDWSFSFVDIIKPDRIQKSPRVAAIIEDRRNSLWLNSESGLYRLRPDGVVECYGTDEGLPENPSSRALLEDLNGQIWCGTNLGLYQLIPDPAPHRNAVAHLYTKKDGVVKDFITTLCETPRGTLWIGTSDGLSEMSSGHFATHGTDHGLSDTHITAITEDRHRNLWIGTSFGGVMRIAANGFTTYGTADGLGGRNIGEIFNDRDGNLMIADGLGHLDRLAGKRFISTSLRLPKGITYWGWGWYQTILQDRKLDWWVPTGGGALRYSNLPRVERITDTPPTAVYTTRNGLGSNEVFRLFEDSSGDIWLSLMGQTRQPLVRWERSTGRSYSYGSSDGIFDAAPSAFCEDSAGALWIGFYAGGLVRYAGGRFEQFGDNRGVPSGLVRGLYFDSSGRLWVATTEGGLGRSDNPTGEHPTFVRYSTAEGLSSNQANCITEDQWGMLWIGTGRGVDKLNPATGYIKHYTTADGLASNFINVSLRHKDGSLWFGTLLGLSRLIPEPDLPAKPPPVLISGLRIAGVTSSIPELGAVNIVVPEIGANQNHVEIDFISLSFSDDVQYQYKLEGASDDWSPPSTQRSVNYPNLPSGSYRFLVRAIDADGTPSTTPAVVTFRVLSPLWKRWWFVTLALAFVALPVFAIARFRFQRLKAIRDSAEALRQSREERLLELEQVRRRIATDLHDDIGASLSQINLLSEVARQRIGRNGSELLEPLEMISNASNEMVDSMSDIVWAINPQKDHLSDLIHRMRRFASDTFSARDIAFNFSAPPDETDVRVGANIRREIFLIFKEGVNNIAKHSGCTLAQIDFQLADDCISLRVTDNGKGFNPDQVSEGHGLASLNERARSLGGTLELVTSSTGTTVTLLVQRFAASG